MTVKIEKIFYDSNHNPIQIPNMKIDTDEWLDDHTTPDVIELEGLCPCCHIAMHIECLTDRNGIHVMYRCPKCGYIKGGDV